jgi:hypothetical protein
LVRRKFAIVAVDLASAKQAAVVTDHDSMVLGGRMDPMLVHHGWEEDFTRDRSDFKDATIIAKRVAELRCYVPYVQEGHWCRLRQLECAWPAVLATAANPLEALTRRAAMAVSTDPQEILAMGLDAFATAVRDELPRWGGTRRNLRILRASWQAAQHPGRVATERATACERATYALAGARTWVKHGYTHLTTRTTNPAASRPGPAALGAALLRQLFVVVTRHIAWDPAIAAGTKEVEPQAA